MRLLRITDDSTFELDLHPFVTVVQGLDERTRPAVLDAVAALTAGRDPGMRGLVEAHGVLFDLDTETLAMLEVAADLDPVVRAADIPRSEGPAARAARLAAEVRDEARGRLEDARRQAEEASTVRAAAQYALDRERAAVAARPPADEEQVAAVRRAVAEAEATRRDLESRLAAARRAHAEAWDAREEEQRVLDEARERRREASEACAQLARALERARADRDPSAEAALQAAAAWVAELEREGEGEGEDDQADRFGPGHAPGDHGWPSAATDRGASAEPAGPGAGPGDDAPQGPPAWPGTVPGPGLTGAPEGGAPAIPPDALRGHIERLEQRRGELLDRLGTPGGLADRVRAALAELRDAGGDTGPLPEALALADEWRQLGDRMAAVAGERPQDVEAVIAARQRLEVARRNLVTAEEAVRVPELDRAVIEALELAHGAVLEAEEKLTGRFAGGRAERRLEAARADEQRLLDELGFRTYADYVIGTSMLHVDAASEARLEAAREELAASEDDWAALAATLDTELDRGAVLDRARAVRERAGELLGEDPGDDIEERLRALRGPAAGGPVAGALRRLLEQVGLYVVDDSHLVGAAEAWLADQSPSGEQERDDARAELAVIEAELADVRHAFQLPVGPPAPTAERDARLEEARAALAAAEQRLAHHREAEALVAELSAALEAAADAERHITAGIATGEERMAEAARPEQQAAAEAAHLEAELVRAVEAELSAVTALAELEPPAGTAAAAGEQFMATALERKLMAAVAAEEAAAGAVERARAALASAEERWREAEHAASLERSSTRRSGPLEEVEWFLLGRLAAQRSVSFAGSVPLVVDDALAALPASARAHLLDRLERMASTVQLIYLGDDPEVAAWADRAGPDRAAVVRPARPDPVSA